MDIQQCNDIESVLDEIKQLFDRNIRHKNYDKDNRHCGSEGHYIEKMLTISHNSKNEPDYKGFEIKKNSRKITFGDWSSSSYLFNQNTCMKKINKIPFNISRDDFMKYFGTYNLKKK